MSDNLVKRLRDWQHVHPEDQDKPAGHLYAEAADRIEELEAENARLKDAFQLYVDANERVLEMEANRSDMFTALAEAIYMLDPDEEDVLKGAGIYRIVLAYELSGGVLPDDLMDALQAMKGGQ